MKTLVKFGFILAVAALACHVRADDANPRITGTVRDLSGAAAAGVRVAFYPGSYPRAAVYSEVRTDTNGRYEIIPQRKSNGAYEIYNGPISLTNSIMARDFERNLAAIQEFVGTATNIDLTLRPGITLTTSVRNTDGVPVDDAMLDFRFLSGNAVVRLEPQSTKVDGLGELSIPALPQGREYLVNGVVAKGYGSAYARVEAKDTQTNSYEFPTIVLKRADRELAGQVVGGDGKPLAGAHVHFGGRGQLPNSTTNTDSEGRFVFDAVCDGPIKLFVNYLDPLDSSIYMNLNGGGGIEVQAGDTNILIRLRDNSISRWDVPTLITTGTVFDPSDKAAPFVSLAVWRSANPFKGFSSDVNGRYRVRWQRLPTDQSRPSSTSTRSVLVARDPAHNLTATQELDESATNVNVHLQPGCTLSGSVLDAEGRPLTNALVSLDLSIHGGAELAKTQVDTNGAFAFSTLPHEGEYTLKVKAAPYAPATTTVTYDSASYSLQLPPFKLTLPNLQLAGTVVGPDDKPIPGIRVDASGASQLLIANTVTDGEGHFVFEKVAEGSIRIWVDNNIGLEAQAGDRDVLLKLRRP